MDRLVDAGERVQFGTPPADHAALGRMLAAITPVVIICQQRLTPARPSPRTSSIRSIF